MALFSTLFPIVVSLLSALFAYWSYQENRKLRIETGVFKRNTELYMLMSDISNKGFQLKLLAHDSIFTVMHIDAVNLDELSTEMNNLLDIVNFVESLNKKLQELKLLLTDNKKLTNELIEQTFRECLELQGSLQSKTYVLERIQKAIEDYKPPSVYEKSGFKFI